MQDYFSGIAARMRILKAVPVSATSAAKRTMICDNQ